MGNAHAYCGSPAVPQDWLLRWNLDPALFAIFGLTLAGYLWTRRSSPRPQATTILSTAGWLLALLAFVSPLCSVSVALFSARVGQHMLLATVCAPLIAFGRPWRSLNWAPRSARPSLTSPRLSYSSLWAAASFGAAMWWWHAPGAYDATFASVPAYWAMHVSIFVSAIWLWTSIIHGPDESFGARVGALALTAVQMGVLGAILTFSQQPLYAVHAMTTWPWGIAPLDDQQIGGAIMWAPSGLLFVAGFGWAFVSMLRRAEQRVSQGLARHAHS